MLLLHQPVIFPADLLKVLSPSANFEEPVYNVSFGINLAWLYTW